MIMYKIFLCINFMQFICLSKSDIADLRAAHQSKSLTDSQVRTLASLTNISDLRKHFDNIAVERVVGTPSHQKVKEYIIDALKKLDWDVERHAFHQNTPVFGKLKFENIIGTLNPNAYRFLVLACHYDSKYTPNEVFIGATDSAVPCAMLLNLIKVMNPYLKQLQNSNDLSLKIVFFDGEEAFRRWGPTDSIYGAKALAKKLANTHFKTNLGRVVTELERWDMLVLLDLLGAPDPKFYNIVQSGQKWYLKFLQAEQRLSKLDLLARYSNDKSEQIYFNPRSTQSFVEDDHIPFMQRGVPIVHLIPLPFPDVWHTTKDNMEVIDVNTVENLNKILRVFVASYLHLKI